MQLLVHTFPVSDLMAFSLLAQLLHALLLLTPTQFSTTISLDSTTPKQPFVIGNVNPTIHCTTSTTMDDDEGLGSFNIFSKFSNTQTSSRNIDELQFYLQKKKEPRTKKFSPLGWWYGNEKQFPVLSAMARDVLNVPI
ncbi:PREDICTED: zinc finger BED domain-containing protein RICESLEEPER 2-like [Nicotiana attenuata]|uniref:zinc finger BED domain-containing protein RICESLEEPER 2-like n=1 Tax=Nicotiana attenuata TaxID=49451 RepID=UPI0009047CC3|nr:PREDICTED: zinc finger BED domain-containing protein RICESLEEPER 2-like [Nicotiana attenuata]